VVNQPCSAAIVLSSGGYRRSLGFRMKQMSNTETNLAALSFYCDNKMMILYRNRDPLKQTS